MSVTVNWDNDEVNVLRYTVTGRWTWEEFYVARDQARQLADSVAQTQIDSIIDIRAGNLFPQNALLHFRKMPSEAHSKLKFGVVVLVGDNFFVKALMDIMRRWNYRAMQNFCIVATFEEAHDILAKTQSQLAS